MKFDMGIAIVSLYMVAYLPWLVLPRSGLVWFFDLFARTPNLTEGSVQANMVNPKPDLRFGSEGGPVLVQQHPNSKPNRIYWKKINLL